MSCNIFEVLSFADAFHKIAYVLKNNILADLTGANTFFRLTVSV